VHIKISWLKERVDSRSCTLVGRLAAIPIIIFNVVEARIAME
jgi:hypothetical protein